MKRNVLSETDSIKFKKQLAGIQKAIRTSVSNLCLKKFDVSFGLKELKKLHDTGKSEYLSYPKMPPGKKTPFERRNWLAVINLCLEREMGFMINVLYEAGILKGEKKRGLWCPIK